MKTLISNVRAVLMDGTGTVLSDAFVAVEGDKITSVGQERPQGTFDREINGKGNIQLTGGKADEETLIAFLYEYLKGGQGVLFAFLPQSKVGHRGTTIRLRGLDEAATYVLHTSKGDIVKSGSYLMGHGLEVRLTGDYASAVVPFEKQQ